LRLLSPTRAFPLLGRELVEEAAKKRTYVIRVLFAVGLCAVFCAMLRGALARCAGSPFAVFGEGEELFDAIVWVLFAGIYLFLPGMVATAIAAERERDSLDMLFVTGIRPGSLLAEKFLGRLLPFFSLLLLALPVLAVAYSLGGIAVERVGEAFLLLCLTCLQVGALALLCSVLNGSVAGAVASAYIAVGTLGLLPFVAERLWGTGMTYVRVHGALAFHLSGQRFLDPGLLACAVWIALTCIAFLVAARLLLLRGARWRLGSLLSLLWRWTDRLVGWGPVVRHDRTLLPTDDPVAWREIRRRGVDTVRHRLRLLILAVGPSLLVWVLAYRHRPARVSLAMGQVPVYICERPASRQDTDTPVGEARSPQQSDR